MDVDEPIITRWIILTLYQYTIDHQNPNLSQPLYIFETLHYSYDLQSLKDKILIPGAQQIKIVFDPKCSILSNLDFLSFHTDEFSNNSKYTFTGSTFNNFEINNCDRIYFSFDINEEMDSHLDSFYGWKFYVYATFPLNESQQQHQIQIQQQLIGTKNRLLNEIINYEDQIQQEKYNSLNSIESFCFSLITKSSLSKLLSKYLQFSDDFTRRFAGLTLCNLFKFPHVCSYFLHYNDNFEFFQSFPTDDFSLITLGYCLNQIMNDQFNRINFILPSTTKETQTTSSSFSLSLSSSSNFLLEKLKSLCKNSNIECKEYIAACLSKIAKESSQTR